MLGDSVNSMFVSAHVPVLPRQVVELLAPQPGDVVVDLTLGLGGHASLIAERIGSSGHILGFDLDPTAVEAAKANLSKHACRFTGFCGRFTDAPARLESVDVRANVVLADLGFNSAQMADPTRGLSFSADGPLDMRLDPSQQVSAADLVNGLPQAELADLIFRYGEDPFARRIAQKLAQIRRAEPIRTTSRLAEAVVEAYGRRARSSRLHPATRTFMALRIAVNDELNSLHTLLEHIERGAREAAHGGWLHPGARVGVISFHSLEDRMVKQSFVHLVQNSVATRITRKPVMADEVEQKENPRSRSAKFRAISIANASIVPQSS